MKWLAVAACVAALCSPAFAQMTPSLFGPVEGQSPYFGSLTSGKPVEGEIGLSLMEAIDRGLQYNFGLYLSTQQGRAASAVRLRALSELLPHLSGSLSESVQQVNLAAFGFPPSPEIPSILGPFSVFDVRASVSENLVNFNSIYKLRAETNNQRAEEFRAKDARDIVVLMIANLYLQTAASDSRVEAAAKQLATAEALFQQAQDLKAAGMVAGIDVLRAQVELESRRQLSIRAKNELEKSKLALARAIGMPLGQKYHLTDAVRPAPELPITLEQALQRAYVTRGDYLAAQALVKGAEDSRKAATAKYYPSVVVQADYGDLGTTPASSHGTFSFLAALHIPIFDGNRTRSDVLEADASLQSARARLDDLHSLIEQQVRTAYLDLAATTEQVQVSQRALDLAGQQLQQSQDRFAAGVAGNLEVVQAQEALAVAQENYISSVYAGNISKALLARAIGGAEAIAREILGGKP